MLIYLATRLVGAGYLMVGASRQVALGPDMDGMTVMFPIPASPSYLEVMGNWDAQWYKSIALNGYPLDLPMTNGQVAMNEWAFYPLFPFLVRILMSPGLSFEFVGAALSTVSAGIAVVLLYRYVLDVPGAGRWTAATVVIGVCCFPSAPSLQIAYTEGISLLLLVLILGALRRRQYGRLATFVLLMAFSRPLVLAVAGVMATLWVVRWWQRDRQPFLRQDRWGLGLITALATLSMGLWPLVTALATGIPDAYLQTQAAWPANQGDNGLLGSWLFMGLTSGLVPVLLTVLAIASLFWFGLRRDSKLLGTELQLWIVIYSMYMLVATRPGPSIVRYLLLGIGPAWLLPGPLPDTDQLGQRRVAIGMTVVLTVVGLGLQYLWVTRVYTVDVHPGVQPYP